MSQRKRARRTRCEVASIVLGVWGVVTSGVISLTACSYDAPIADCEALCRTSTSCPDDFTCVAGVCRAPGQTGSCVAPGSITLRQTDTDKIERNLVFGCTNTDGTTPDGSWYRVFSLQQAGVTGTFHVDHVTLGICFAVGDPMVTVKLGLYGGSLSDVSLDLAKVTPLTSTTVTIPATQITELVDAKMTADVSAGANLVAEMSITNRMGTGQQVNIGLTASGESHPGYIRSPLCGPATPMTTASIGHADAHMVITVTGTQ